MLKRIVTLMALVLLGAIVASCGSRPKQPGSDQTIFDVRRAQVTAPAGIPPTVIVGVQRRINQAIEATSRPVAVPRVVIDVRIGSVSTGLGANRGRSQADLQVIVTSIDSGEAFRDIRFQVESFTLDARHAEEALAEAIAQRLRFIFQLNMPPARLMATQPQISTRLATDPALDPVEPVAKAPVVVPVSAVKTRIGADADPVLNSKSKLPEEAPEKAKVEPALKPAASTEKTVDDGAAAKVSIVKPAAEPAAEPTEQPVKTESEPAKAETPANDGEPCVETLDKTCPGD